MVLSLKKKKIMVPRAWEPYGSEVEVQQRNRNAVYGIDIIVLMDVKFSFQSQ